MGSRQRTIPAIAAAVAISALAISATAAPAVPPRADADGGDVSVKVLECSTGNRARDRWAIFRGEMAQVPGGDRMDMRFALRQRVRRGQWARVEAPGLSVPHVSRPGVREFAFNQRIRRLEKGTVYRAIVAFRWYDADGRRIARRRARSRPCRQGGALPDLEVDVLDVRGGPIADTARYLVEVRNSGRTAARRSELRVEADGAEIDTRRIGPLRAGARRVIAFVGPPCPVGVSATIDPSDAVRELDERHNVVHYRCP